VAKLTPLSGVSLFSLNFPWATLPYAQQQKHTVFISVFFSFSGSVSHKLDSEFSNRDTCRLRWIPLCSGRYVNLTDQRSHGKRIFDEQVKAFKESEKRVQKRISQREKKRKREADKQKQDDEVIIGDDSHNNLDGVCVSGYLCNLVDDLYGNRGGNRVDDRGSD
jgi:hypothetical protein